jgi:lipopolysaccharide transport system ATP-binding protein
MRGAAIRFSNVSKRFRKGERHDSLRDLVPSVLGRLTGRGAGARSTDRDFWALRHINLEIREGESVGVIGHNGAGKSTMLKHFARIMWPTEGVIEVNGRLSALIEVGAGFHPDLTGRENVFLNGVILGMSRAEIARKFDEIVEFAGLAPFIDTPIKRYSSGMFARLGFAVAAHLDPDILVIDEVLSVGDYVFQQKSLQKMRSIAKSGATVVFVSHNLKAVSDLCARTVLLDSGKIVEDGGTPHVIRTYLDRERSKLEGPKDTDVAIQTVRMRGVKGESTHFEPGERAWVDVTFEARRRCERVAVVLEVLDEGMQSIFNTSSERLGARPVDLEAGQSYTVTFELAMHLAIGTFHLGAYLFRYDIELEYDRALPARTFFMISDVDVQGAANLYPRVVAPMLQSAGGSTSRS